jgi:large subunit ribosomal protein L30
MPRTFVWHPGRGPKQTSKNELTTGKVRIRQVRSGIGPSWRMNRTLEGIGLKLQPDEVSTKVSPSLRGQLKQVRHLIEVEPVEE